MKYWLTRDELNRLAFYMTLQKYKEVKTWVGTAILAFVVINTFSAGGGVFSWLANYLILLVLYFVCIYLAGISMNQKATGRVELILENGRVRKVSEEGEYGVSFRAGEISRRVSFRGLLILVRECWCGEGKNRICVGTVYYAIPERIFENNEAKKAFLDKLEEEGAAATDPEETAGGRNPRYVFEFNTTEEGLAKLRDLTYQYQVSKKGSYRRWLKFGLFVVGFVLAQAVWMLMKVFYAVTNAQISYDKLQSGDTLFLMCGILAGLLFMQSKANRRGQLRRIRRSKKEQANLGFSRTLIFDKVWVMQKGEFEGIMDWNQFEGVVEFEDCYLFVGKSKNGFLLLNKDEEDQEKLQSFISYCKERGNYEVYQEPKKWSLGKKIFTMIICLAMVVLAGFVDVGVSMLEDSPTEPGTEETFVFHPEEYEDYVPFEKQLEVMEQLGFTVSQDSIDYLEEWMSEEEYGGYGRVYVEGYPYYELLMELGYPTYDEDTWEVVEYSKQAYWMDFEGWDISTDYIQILKGVAAMSEGEVTFTDMMEDIYNVDWDKGEGTIDVTFKCSGELYEFEAKVEDDWIDTDFIGFLNEVLDSEGYTKNIYACYDGGQGNVLFYRDEAWAKRFVELTGIELVLTVAAGGR